MPEPDRGEIRVTKQHPTEPRGIPSSRTLIAVAAIAAVALASTFLARTVSAPQATDITDPDVPATASTTSLPDIRTDTEPLSELVPGFEGTLVMVVAIADAVERWEWPAEASSPSRLPLFGHLRDARTDASGSLVAAIERYAHDPRVLQIGEGPSLGDVFYGVHTFAWHASEPARLAWISQSNPEAPAEIHVAYSEGRTVYAMPLARYPGVDLVTPGRRDGVRIAGYDDFGVIIEHWSFGDEKFTATVSRVSLDGEVVAEVEGVFAGLAPDGTVAVGSATDLAAGPVLYGPEMEAIGSLDGPAGQVLWSPDLGARAAIFPGPVVEVRSGGHATTFAVPLENPTLKAWSPDGRFVVVAGVRDEVATLAFADTADASVNTVRLSAFPVDVRVIP